MLGVVIQREIGVSGATKLNSPKALSKVRSRKQKESEKVKLLQSFLSKVHSRKQKEEERKGYSFRFAPSTFHFSNKISMLAKCNIANINL